jgi:Ser/Thr protein kinase RdoA (MazF antagonist)
VLRVVDLSGTAWIGKRYRIEKHYRAEIRAYRRWADHLGGRAPRLVAADDELLALVISVLPGTMPAKWDDPSLLHQAGELLRALHEAEQFPVYEDLVADKLAEFEDVASDAIALLGPRMVEYTRKRLQALEDGPALRRVPCHLDYSPRNWLVDDDRLYVIDFGDSAPDAWINDFGRLFIGWHLGPSGRRALLGGYGMTPTDDDLELLNACYAARLVCSVVFAHHHGYEKVGLAFRQLLCELIPGE